MVDVDAAADAGAVKKILKVLVVGEMAAGKAALVRRYVDGSFSEIYKTTIGAAFANKDFEWDQHTSITLQLCNIAGQERCGNMTHVYYREAVAAFIVFDLTRISTLDMVPWWKRDIDSKVLTSDERPIPCLLLGNKIDLCQGGRWAKDEDEMRAFVEQHKFLGFIVTSAKDGTNVDTAARTLIQHVIDNKIEPHGAKDDRGVDITTAAARGRNSKGCC